MKCRDDKYFTFLFFYYTIFVYLRLFRKKRAFFSKLKKKKEISHRWSSFWNYLIYDHLKRNEQFPNKHEHYISF
jgi:hypothetical protein